METETILIILGAILIGISIVGGNLEWKEFKIPKIHIAARILGFITGLILIVVGPNIKTIGLFGPPAIEDAKLKTEEQRLVELQRQQAEAQNALQADEQRLAVLKRQIKAAQNARQIEEQKLAALLRQQEEVQKALAAQTEQLTQPQKNLVAQEQRLGELQHQQEQAQKAIAAQKLRLAELQRQIDAAQKTLAAKTQQLAETLASPVPVETPTQLDEKIDVSDNFSLKRSMFETQQQYQARISQAVEQRDLRYQAGVAHLKSYDVDSETLVMSLEWQAAWAKPFLGPWNPNKHGIIKVASSDAQALWQAGKEKQLLITLEIAENSLKVEKVILIDGEQTRAVTLSRYVDNGNGTVTDNRTGLIWLKNANCFGGQDWKTAMQSAADIVHGQCGLGDGSTPGMWRLPTKEELEAMVDKRYRIPALSNAEGTAQWKKGDAFSGVQSSWYWSSTTAIDTSSAWYVYLNYGNVRYNVQSFAYDVWAVRGGQ